MTIAVLFDSEGLKRKGLYDLAVRDLILTTDVLQGCSRHMKVRVGNVVTHTNSSSKHKSIELAGRIFFAHSFKRLDKRRLRAAYLKRAVFAWVIQNIDVKTANKLHRALTREPAYFGIHGVELSDPTHWAVYRTSMISKYRIKSRSCHIFFSMGEKEARDKTELRELKRLGFRSVEWEDYGAHETIFDDFDSLHFQRVADFKKIVSPHLVGHEDEAEDAVLMLEDLNPRLFDALGAAARTLRLANTEEDLAQVAISVRRYIEQLADSVFPAQKQPFNGRAVTQANFRNRIWAYIDKSIPIRAPHRLEKLKTLGKEVDRLIDEVNACLHGKPAKNRLVRIFKDLVKITAAILQLDPETARQPYFAFYENIHKFFTGGAKKRVHKT